MRSLPFALAFAVVSACDGGDEGLTPGPEATPASVQATGLARDRDVARASFHDSAFDRVPLGGTRRSP